MHDIVTRGGRCLIPVFALGRAQELLLILGKKLQANTSWSTLGLFMLVKHSLNNKDTLKCDWTVTIRVPVHGFLQPEINELFKTAYPT